MFLNTHAKCKQHQGQSSQLVSRGSCTNGISWYKTSHDDMKITHIFKGVLNLCWFFNMITTLWKAGSTLDIIIITDAKIFRFLSFLQKTRCEELSILIRLVEIIITNFNLSCIIARFPWDIKAFRCLSYLAVLIPFSVIERIHALCPTN